jgi:hypothetical protein
MESDSEVLCTDRPCLCYIFLCMDEKDGQTSMHTHKIEEKVGRALTA